MDDLKREAMSGVVKIAPPSTASMWLMLGNHLDDWIKIATLAYIVVQCTALCVTKYLPWTGQLKGKEDE